MYKAAIGTHMHIVLTKADITQHFNAVNTIELDKDFNADSYDYEKLMQTQLRLLSLYKECL